VALLRQLTRLSRAVAQADSLDQILQLAANHASAILDAEQSLVMLVGDDGLAHVRASVGVDALVADTLRGKLDENLISHLQSVLASGQGSFMAIPLIVQGEVTGLLAVTRSGTEPWEDEDEMVLAAVADQVRLPVAVNPVSPDTARADDRLLEDRSGYMTALPLHVPRDSDVDREQSRGHTPFR